MSGQELDELGDRIMKLQVFHADQFDNELNKIQMRSDAVLMGVAG